MLTAELLKKIRSIEIRTRGLSRQVFAGEYHSAFKGQGMMFTEVREYQYGDPIRSIDWNVTARFNKPFVKVFEEERELTVMILVDVSGSNDFGTHRLKRELMTELAAVLAFSAMQNNDKIGVILFSDRIEKFIPPKKGKKHIMRIILDVLNYTPEHKGTDVSQALRYLTHIIKKRSTVFVISDFMMADQSKINELRDTLRLVNRKHDLIGLRIQDPGEQKVPPLGLIRLFDPETGSERWVDADSRAFKKYLAQWWHNHDKQLEEIFKRTGVDHTFLSTHEDYVIPLVKLFKSRARI